MKWGRFLYSLTAVAQTTDAFQFPSVWVVKKELSFRKLHEKSVTTTWQCLQPGNNDPGVFNGSLDLAQEEDGLATIDQPVVVGQRDVHHWPDDHLKQMYVDTHLATLWNNKKAKTFCYKLK